MRKALKILGILVALILIFITGAAVYIKGFLPDVGPAPDLKVEATPEKVERGRYLAHHVMICVDCHSIRDFNYFAGPVDMNTLGRGGDIFDEKAGFPGKIVAANITPTGIGDWTDGELFRAITTGVRKNGKPIFPVMPYHNYGKADPEDVEAVIAYIRTLPPLGEKTAESSYDFPMNFIVNTIPEKATPGKRPSPSDRLAYGKYLLTTASCGDCHTPFNEGTYDTSKWLAGGREFLMPGGKLTSANITPDKETGIGNLTVDDFLERFRAYRDSSYAHRKIDFMKDFATVMPWSNYAGMTDEDLSAIYEYLRTVPAVKHQINKFEPRK
ncbi:MAG: c-type cytochrome [Chitinophagaceae bacterium]|nr:c-type cytochrome [Chitinophagaceae bacterium]